jgi:hypothetical protein
MDNFFENIPDLDIPPYPMIDVPEPYDRNYKNNSIDKEDEKKNSKEIKPL